MKPSTVISVRISKELKKDAEELFNELGINTSSAINMFLSQCVHDQALPFTPSAQIPVETREFSPRLIAAVDEADAILRGDVKRKSYRNVKKMFKEILKNAETDTDDANTSQ